MCLTEWIPGEEPAWGLFRGHRVKTRKARFEAGASAHRWASTGGVRFATVSRPGVPLAILSNSTTAGLDDVSSRATRCPVPPVPGYTSCMTARDVVITRVHDRLGLPSVEELWAVTAEGKASLTTHLFSEALDAALTWTGESGGEIYRRDRPGAEPRLYKAAW